MMANAQKECVPAVLILFMMLEGQYAFHPLILSNLATISSTIRSNALKQLSAKGFIKHHKKKLRRLPDGVFESYRQDAWIAYASCTLTAFKPFLPC